MAKPFWKAMVAMGVLYFALGAISSEALAKGKPPPKDRDEDVAPPPTIDPDVELNANWAIPYIKAPKAWKAGSTGKGITIGIMDSGVAQNSEFDGRLMRMWDGYRNRYTDSKDDNGHGTFVAGLAAAALDERGMVGVAYDANILPIKVISRSGSMRLNDAQLAKAFEIGQTGDISRGIVGATVLNNSWNSSATAYELDAAYNDPVAAIENAYGLTLAAMQGFVDGGGGGRMTYDPNDPTNSDFDSVAVGGVIVFAAGNDGKDNPGWWASLPYFKPDLEPGYLASVAVDQDGVIAPWSNRCGVSANYCLAAPGSAVTSTLRNGSTGTGSGTSFSAPIVSGAVAVMAQHWDYLKSSTIAQILLTTADSTNYSETSETGIDYSDTLVYGQGLLDLNAALQPSGEVLLAGSSATGSTSGGTTGGGGLTGSISSAAFGNFGARGQVLVLDEYRRDYAVSTSALIDRSRDSFDGQMALSRFGFGGVSTEVVNYAGMKTTLTYVHSPVGAYGYNGEGQTTHFDMGDGYGVSFGVGVTPQMAMGLTPLRDQWRGLTVADKPMGHGYAAALQDAVSAGITMPVHGVELTVGMATGQSSRDSIQTSVGLNRSEPWNTRRQKIFSVRAAMPVGERVKVALNLGTLDEDRAALGNRQTGLFGLGSDARTSFAGFSGEVAVNQQVTMFAGYEMGRTKMNGSTGALVGHVDTIRSDSWRVGVAATRLLGERDRAMFAVAQPLRVNGGSVTTVLPTTYNGFTDTVGYDTAKSSLAAERRELSIQTAYATPLWNGFDLSLGGMVRLNPNNEKAPADFVGLAKLGWRY